MNGIIVVNKEKNMTSRDVVNIANKVLNTKKIGHTGTLDPIASGVLVLCVNDGTKLVEYLTNHEKDYVATVKLGILTDTLDSTGNIIKEESVNVDKELLINTLNSFNKEYLQEVPIYSAVKVNGKKLYEYARNNEVVELPKRMVKISNIKLLEFNGNEFKFMVHVSKGTYIRALINDICNSMNTIGIMTDLVRIKQGDFSIDNAISIEDLKNNRFNIISIKDCLKNIPMVELDESLSKQILNGGVYQSDIDNEYILFTLNGEAKCLYHKASDGIYHMNKFFK